MYIYIHTYIICVYIYIYIYIHIHIHIRLYYSMILMSRSTSASSASRTSEEILRQTAVVKRPFVRHRRSVSPQALGPREPLTPNRSCGGYGTITSYDMEGGRTRLAIGNLVSYPCLQWDLGCRLLVCGAQSSRLRPPYICVYIYIYIYILVAPLGPRRSIRAAWTTRRRRGTPARSLALGGVVSQRPPRETGAGAWNASTIWPSIFGGFPGKLGHPTI